MVAANYYDYKIAVAICITVVVIALVMGASEFYATYTKEKRRNVR